MTIGQWLADAEAELRLDAELILASCLKIERSRLLAHQDEVMPKERLRPADRLLEQRRSRIPLAQLLREREFYGLTLEVTPDVLVPRVETEKMVEMALKHVPKGSRVLDMGTGSGALAVALAKHRPDLDLVASDISPAALEVAKRNAKRYGLSIDFVQSDLWEAIKGSFGAVLTNLPYLSEEAMSQLMEDAKHEPPIALEGGSDGLDIYRRFLGALPEHLSAGGLLFTECDPWQQSELMAEAAKRGLRAFAEDYFVLGFGSRV